MVRAFRIEAQDKEGDWHVIAHEENNYQRLVQIETNVQAQALRLVPETTWGADQVHIFAWDVR